MDNKIYNREMVFMPYSTKYHVKIGNTGKSHKTPRPYSNIEYGGASTGDYTSDGEGDSLVHRYDPREILTRAQGLLTNPGQITNLDNIFHNTLISKLRGKLGPSAGLGESIFAEGGEAVRMAVKNLTEMAQLARALKRGDLIRLYKRWGKSRRKPQQVMAEAGGRWLEFSWGWSPLVNSVYEAMKATTAAPPDEQYVIVTHRTEYHDGYRYKYGYLTSTTNFHAQKAVKVGAGVKVTNPNAWLASELGLINPVSWGWEAIPFSWLADYFVNVGSLIGNLDRFAGLSISGRYTTTVIKSSAENTSRKMTPGNPKFFGGYQTGKAIIRETGMPPLDMKLTYNFVNPLTKSWQRGANASSFLATRLRKP